VAFDKLAAGGVNTRAADFATPRQQSQYVNQIVATMTEAGPHQFAAADMGVQTFDNLGERLGPVAGNRGALLGLVQAGMMRRIGSERRAGHEQAAKQGYREYSGNRHGG
jgi:hypothetical protein